MNLYLLKNNFLILVSLILFNFLLVTTATSQDDPSSLINDNLGINKTVAVIPFATSFDFDRDEADYSIMLTERVQTAIEQTKRFIMVERINLEKVLEIKREQDENEQEYMYWKKITDGQLNHLVKAGRQLGVEYIFTGNISNVETPFLVSGGYGGEFGFTIKVISVETSKLYVTESFNVGTDKLLGKSSQKEALNAALENLIEPVKKFIDKNFPLEIPFFKAGIPNRKGLIKTIIIKGGILNGLREGQTLDIALIGEGSYREKIGEVKIIEPEQEYSSCKIIKGASEITKHIKENKELIIAKTRAYGTKGFFKK